MDDISNEAETGSPQDTVSPAAGTQEHQIPKHRFDEVNQRKSDLEAENRALRGLLERHAQAAQPQQRQQAPSIDFGQFGLDEATGKAFMAVAEQVVGQKLQAESQMLRQQIGFQQNSIEELAFLNKYGHDKEDLLPSVRARKEEYAKKFGSYLPTEDAFKLILAEQTLRPKKPAAQTAQVQQVQQTAPSQQAQTGVPNASMTRLQPGTQANAGQVRQISDEAALEEMEAQLNDRLASGESF